MTSPLETFNAERTFYFDAVLGGDLKKFDEMNVYSGDDLKIVFTVKDANENAVELTGVTASLTVAASGTKDAIITKTVGDGISLNGETATVSFNADDLGEVFTEFNAQFRITKAGKSVMASAGKINVRRRIE